MYTSNNNNKLISSCNSEAENNNNDNNDDDDTNSNQSSNDDHNEVNNPCKRLKSSIESPSLSSSFQGSTPHIIQLDRFTGIDPKFSSGDIQLLGQDCDNAKKLLIASNALTSF